MADISTRQVGVGVAQKFQTPEGALISGYGDQPVGLGSVVFEEVGFRVTRRQGLDI